MGKTSVWFIKVEAIEVLIIFFDYKRSGYSATIALRCILHPLLRLLVINRLCYREA